MENDNNNCNVSSNRNNLNSAWFKNGMGSKTFFKRARRHSFGDLSSIRGMVPHCQLEEDHDNDWNRSLEINNQRDQSIKQQQQQRRRRFHPRGSKRMLFGTQREWNPMENHSSLDSSIDAPSFWQQQQQRKEQQQHSPLQTQSSQSNTPNLHSNLEVAYNKLQRSESALPLSSTATPLNAMAQKHDWKNSEPPILFHRGLSMNPKVAATRRATGIDVDPNQSRVTPRLLLCVPSVAKPEDNYNYFSRIVDDTTTSIKARTSSQQQALKAKFGFTPPLLQRAHSDTNRPLRYSSRPNSAESSIDVTESMTTFTTTTEIFNGEGIITQSKIKQGLSKEEKKAKKKKEKKLKKEKSKKNKKHQDLAEVMDESLSDYASGALTTDDDYDDNEKFIHYSKENSSLFDIHNDSDDDDDAILNVSTNQMTSSDMDALKINNESLASSRTSSSTNQSCNNQDGCNVGVDYNSMTAAMPTSMFNDSNKWNDCRKEVAPTVSVQTMHLTGIPNASNKSTNPTSSTLVVEPTRASAAPTTKITASSTMSISPSTRSEASEGIDHFETNMTTLNTQLNKRPKSLSAHLNDSRFRSAAPPQAQTYHFIPDGIETKTTRPGVQLPGEYYRSYGFQDDVDAIKPKIRRRELDDRSISGSRSSVTSRNSIATVSLQDTHSVFSIASGLSSHASAVTRSSKGSTQSAPCVSLNRWEVDRQLQKSASQRVINTDTDLFKLIQLDGVDTSSTKSWPKQEPNSQERQRSRETAAWMNESKGVPHKVSISFRRLTLRSQMRDLKDTLYVENNLASTAPAISNQVAPPRPPLLSPELPLRTDSPPAQFVPLQGELHHAHTTTLSVVATTVDPNNEQCQNVLVQLVAMPAKMTTITARADPLEAGTTTNCGGDQDSHVPCTATLERTKKKKKTKKHKDKKTNKENYDDDVDVDNNDKTKV